MSRVSTHWVGCGMSDPTHYGCLQREHRELKEETERLRAALKHISGALEGPAMSPTGQRGALKECVRIAKVALEN